MRKHQLCKGVQEIYGMLDFYLRKVTRGLLPFMDRNISLPSSWEIAEILKSNMKSVDLGVKITKGQALPEQQQVIEISEPYTEIIEKYGGIEEIQDSFEHWESYNHNGWKMLFDWSTKGFNGLKTMADIADNNGYSNPATPYKLRKVYLEEIAFDIFMKYTSKQCKKLRNKSDNKTGNKVDKKEDNDKGNIDARIAIVGRTEQAGRKTSA